MRAALILASLLTAHTAIAQNALWVDISGDWRLIIGRDQPGFAARDFDDRTWPTMKLPFVDGFGIPYKATYWLRRQVSLPETADRTKLSLTLGIIWQSVYEVYVNGQRIGVTGDFNSYADAQVTRPLAFSIPAEAAAGSGPIEIAIRAKRCLFMHPGWRLPDGGPYAITDLAHAPVQAGAIALTKQRERQSSVLMFGTGFFFIMLLSVLAWWSEPSRRELLWFALVSLSRVAESFVFMDGLFVTAHPFSSIGVPGWELVLNQLCIPLLGEVVLCALGTRAKWLRAVLWLGWSALPITVLLQGNVFHATAFGNIWAEAFSIAVILWDWNRLRRANAALEEHALRLTLLVLALYTIQFWICNTLQIPNLIPESFLLGPYDVSSFDLLLILISSVILVLLIRRLVADRRERQRLSGELEAAGVIQRLLLKKPGLREPNLVFDAVYMPAQEVGGDFYYVLDGRMVVIGDVSGKGLKAAMMVSLLIGVLRATVERHPAGVLSALNRAVAGQMENGFVTCLCARFEAEGAVTIANAGHLPPYAAGIEVPLVPGLPLGLDPASTYEETLLTLAPGLKLVLLSDGVAEAANAKDELFGFDRTREISGDSAQAIAEAAQSWGQNDDITVVTVRRSA